MATPKKKTQKKAAKKKTGFSMVEGLLMLIIAALIIFVVWFIYSSTSYSETTLNAAVKTDNSTPKFVKRTKVSTAPAQQ